VLLRHAHQSQKHTVQRLLCLGSESKSSKLAVAATVLCTRRHAMPHHDHPLQLLLSPCKSIRRSPDAEDEISKKVECGGGSSGLVYSWQRQCQGRVDFVIRDKEVANVRRRTPHSSS